MRKTLITIMIIGALSTVLYATPLFQVGPMATYKHSIIDLADEEKLTDIASYGGGVDARLNLLDWISIDVPASYAYGNGVHTIAIDPSLNLNIPAVGFIDIALGVAVNLNFQFDQSSNTWYINGEPISGFSNAFLGASIAYRGAITLNFGMLGLGVAALVPTDGSFQHFNAIPSWSETQISVVLLFNFL